MPGSVPSPKDFPEGDRFRPRSSHPDKTSPIAPMLKQIEGTDHYYAELPDSELKRLGIEPYRINVEEARKDASVEKGENDD